jgi:hypothetical protein
VCKSGQEKILLFFCIKKVAIAPVSGIITTNLGKTATPIKIAGREKTDTSLQNVPFSRTGEGHFFCPAFYCSKPLKTYIKQSFKVISGGMCGALSRLPTAICGAASFGDGIPCIRGAKCNRG